MTESTIIPLNFVERKPNSNKYRVVGKGITVEFLSRLINDPAWTVDEICENYGLTPAEVHAAWAFYYERQAEIDRNIRDGEALMEQYFAEHPDQDERRAALIRKWEAQTGKVFGEDD